MEHLYIYRRLPRLLPRRASRSLTTWSSDPCLPCTSGPECPQPCRCAAANSREGTLHRLLHHYRSTSNCLLAIHLQSFLPNTSPLPQVSGLIGDLIAAFELLRFATKQDERGIYDKR